MEDLPDRGDNAAVLVMGDPIDELGYVAVDMKDSVLRMRKMEVFGSNLEQPDLNARERSDPAVPNLSRILPFYASAERNPSYPLLHNPAHLSDRPLPKRRRCPLCPADLPTLPPPVWNLVDVYKRQGIG